MKSGELIIDGVDVYGQYGVYVVTGGWNDLVAFPPLKAIDYNDWHEYNGIEPDLSDPKLNSRDVSMKFAGVNGYSGFVDLLLGAPKHTFECAAIGRTFKNIRLVQQPSLSLSTELGMFTLKVADDEPMDRTEHTRLSPQNTLVPWSPAWGIDSRLLYTYGIRVLAGSLAEAQKAPAVKLNLLRNIKTQTGATYDGHQLRKQSKDIKLSCLMRATSLTQFWRNHDTLLYDLIQPNERNLQTPAGTFKCYYKSSSVSEFYPDGYPWMKFTLTLCATQP